MAFVGWLLQLLFPAYQAQAPWIRLTRTLFLVTLIVLAVPYFSIPVRSLGFNPGWMHHVHLVFHEAGHAITAMISNNHTLVVFMGSGLQVLFPLILAGAFYFKNRDAFGAAVCLVWAGHAALDVAPYIGDSRALELPLLGGGNGEEIEGHDWLYLLHHWHALPNDLLIAERVALGGRLLMIVAFMWGLLALVYEQFVLSRSESLDKLGADAASLGTISSRAQNVSEKLPDRR